MQASKPTWKIRFYYMFNNKEKMTKNNRTESNSWANPEGVGDRGLGPPRKSQVAIGLLRNTGTDPL